MTWVAWVLCACLGGLEAIAHRNAMNPDGISYLDMGDAFLRGDWGLAVNPLWSPLYGALLGVANAALQPTPQAEFALVHAVNFVIFLYAMGCLHFLLQELLTWRTTEGEAGREAVGVPRWSVIALGYALFLQVSLRWVYMASVTPDMGVLAQLLLATGLLLRIRRLGPSPGRLFGFGAVLGIGYLIKAPFLPLSVVYLVLALLPSRRGKWGGASLLSAACGFVLFAGPFVAALSLEKGALTIGASGRLNQIWKVNQTANRWRDSEAIHPLRRIHRDPAVFEFAEPVRTTYPVMYDPSVWMEGIEPYFDARQQGRQIKSNLGVCLGFFRRKQLGLAVGFLALLLLCGGGKATLAGVRRQWPLLVPALAGFAMYLPILVLPRYVGAFVLLLWLGLLSGVRGPRTRAGRWVALPLAWMLLALMTPLLRGIPHAVSRASEPHLQWEVARSLGELGVAAGDPVAYLGEAGTAHWARLARVRIVAEIPFRRRFWRVRSASRELALEALARGTRARVLVTPGPPPARVLRASKGWTRIEGTSYYVLGLDRHR